MKQKNNAVRNVRYITTAIRVVKKRGVAKGKKRPGCDRRPRTSQSTWTIYWRSDHLVGSSFL